MRIAERHRENKKFNRAAATLARVDPAFKNVSNLISELKAEQLMFEQTEVKRKNNALLTQGKQLFKQGNYLDALDTFLKIDPNSEEAARAISATKQKLQIAAEFHFKEGIKLFMKEKLDEANFGMAKNAENWRRITRMPWPQIEKAQNLLTKIREIN